MYRAVASEIGLIASEEVILQLMSTECLPILLYGLEVLPIRQSQLRSLNFKMNKLFMKLFKTNDRAYSPSHLCQDPFHFHLPSEL